MVFLPACLAVYLFLIRHGWRKQSFDWLVVASLLFYGWWKWSNLPLLVGSLLFNYTAGTWLGKLPSKSPAARVLLAAGIGANLLFLGYFKYADFFIENVNELSGANWAALHIVLPLGIS
ncbi:MAG TPA: MBOAT family protein, partial [Clostridia bacterium]|nr:MBOAT family protein [Clostridia bacterium]